MPPLDFTGGTISRRRLLAMATAAGGTSLVLPLLGCETATRVIRSGYPFTLGVASGDPLPDGVVLWTRLAPDPLNGGGMPMAPIHVVWEVGADPEMKTIVRNGGVLARPELAHSVHVEVAGLEPDREYWYRFWMGKNASQIGRTKTAPAADAQSRHIKFAFCGCQQYEMGYFTAFRHLAAENVDFVFHTGDYIYEYGAREGRVRRHNGGEVSSLPEYRNRYALYKADPDLIAAHASAPFIVSWDDHEVDNNWAADRDQDRTPPELFDLRRAAAFQAYYEHMPLRASAIPRGTQLRLHRLLRFGNLVNFHVLDTRQYRDDQPCNDHWRTDCEDAKDPRRTMLGAAQERWLFGKLATASAKWNVLAQQVPTYRMARVRDGQIQLQMDKWDGYQAARDRLYDALLGYEVSNPVVLSGDIHTNMAAELKLDYENPSSRRVGVEFTNTSISSDGDGAEKSRFWQRVMAANPHMIFHNHRRGYVVCDVTPDRWLTEFKVVDKVTEPGAPIRTAQKIVVEDAEPALKIA